MLLARRASDAPAPARPLETIELTVAPRRAALPPVRPRSAGLGVRSAILPIDRPRVAAVVPHPNPEVRALPAAAALPPVGLPPEPAGPNPPGLISLRAGEPQLGQAQLFDPTAIAGVAGVPAGPLPSGGGDSGPPTDADLGAEAQASVQTFVTDTESAYRVEAGAVDPYFYDLARRAQHYFQPSRAELAMIADPSMASKLNLFAPSSVAPTVGPMRRYDHAIPIAPDSYNKWSSAVAQMGEVQGHTEHDENEVGVTVDVWIAPTGAIDKVAVEQTSGVKALDDDALAAVQQAVGAVPRPASSGAHAVETRWLCTASLGNPVTTAIDLLSVVDR